MHPATVGEIPQHRRLTTNVVMHYCKKNVIIFITFCWREALLRHYFVIFQINIFLNLKFIYLKYSYLQYPEKGPTRHTYTMQWAAMGCSQLQPGLQYECMTEQEITWKYRDARELETRDYRTIENQKNWWIPEMIILKINWKQDAPDRASPK